MTGGNVLDQLFFVNGLVEGAWIDNPLHAELVLFAAFEEEDCVESQVVVLEGVDDLVLEGVVLVAETVGFHVPH